MKKITLTILFCLATASLSFAGNILFEGFEYANHDLEKPVGWTCDNDSWRCGYLEKDHNRIPHTGNWYAFTDGDEAWMFMPFYMIQSMKYRFNIWAITDGAYSLSLWAGSAPNPEAMTAQFFSENVSSEDYTKISTYIEEIPIGCEYIGLCAIKLQSGTFLTIDDLEADMVEQYTFEAEAITSDTAMYPGTEALFRFLIHNTGYDPVDVTMHPSNESFTNISCHSEGVVGNTFHTEPDETIEVTALATLRPEIQPGTVAWLDIQMTIPCNCNTAMVTFWVTPLDMTSLLKGNTQTISVFPNPTADYVIVEAEGLQQVILIDGNGKTLSSIATEGRFIRLDVSNLKAGIYFISAKTRSTSSFVKPILKM